jgi:TPR repeat protein
MGNSAANSGATPAVTNKDQDADNEAESDPNSPPAANPKSTEAVVKPAPKPPAAIPPVARIDNVTEAQKYIYGRGVAQDCERGMRLLKPAANQSNPKAMIEMGALYSAGLCTPHDLPTAYRWFARALRKDPDNQAVQTDLQKLWGEMTQPERQLAIKLSQ